MNTYMALAAPAHDDDYHLAAHHNHFLSPPASLSSQVDISPTSLWDLARDIHNFSSSPCFVRDHCSLSSHDTTQRKDVPSDANHTTLFQPYPSPPLTDASLSSTVPLPEVHLLADYFLRHGSNSSAQDNMPCDPLAFRAPLSPPPTHLISPSELPSVDHLYGHSRDDDFPDLRLPVEAPGEVPFRHATASWDPLQNGPSDRVSYEHSSLAHSRAPGSRGWSFEGTLSELGAVSAHAPTDPHILPSRGDSGFEEFLPQHKSSVSGLPSLPEESEGDFAKIEPTAYWTPQSPLSMHTDLDDHFPQNPALLRPDCYHSSAIRLSSVRSSRSHSTPSWSSHDWSSSSDCDDDFSPPPSPRPRSLSLDALDEFSSSPHYGFEDADSRKERPALLGLDELESPRMAFWPPRDDHEHDTSYGDTDYMNIDSEPPPPSSPRPSLALLMPTSSSSSESSFTDTVISPEDGPWSTSLSPSAYSDIRNSHGDPLCITPVPRSPHRLSATLPDSSADDFPPSPSSPNLALPEVSDGLSQPHSDEYIAETVAPSLLSPPREDQEGLGLFLQPISIDPPLARSPSPDDDDLQFLDVQLDPTSTTLGVDEFLQLRAVRRRALSAERAARTAEAELSERVSAAANALLPPSYSTPDIDMDPSDPPDDDAKRARKHELHVAMDMRAEARRARKREKQRSKEVGALLDLKLERGVAPGKGAMRSIAQLVANMVLRRRDTFRPLANRKTGAPRPPYMRTPLSCSVSAEDLLDTMDVDIDAMDVESDDSDMEQD